MAWGCVCFDLDNTLCDYEQAFEDGMKACYEWFAKHEWLDKSMPVGSKWFPVFKSLCDRYWAAIENKTYTKQEYQRRRLIDSLKAFGVTISEEEADRFQAHFYEQVDKHVTLYPNVDLLLSKLHAKHVKLGIITNGKEKTQERKILRLGLDRWFSMEQIFISEKLHAAKPDQSIFRYAEKALCVESVPKLYVGDSWELDVLGAVNAGWEALYLNTRGEEKPSSSLPYAVCETIEEAMDVILHRKW